MLTLQLLNEHYAVPEFEDKNMLWPITNLSAWVRICSFIYWWMERMFYDLNISKLPATTVRFLKIIVVSKRKKL